MTASVQTRPSIGELLTLAGPVVISRSAQVVVGFTDAAMVGRLGESELAAATTGAANAGFVLILPLGVVFIVSSFASQFTGKGDPAGARRFAWYGLLVAAMAQALGVLAVPLLGPTLGALDYTPEVRDLMTGYMAWRLLGTGFAVGLEALGAYYGGLGNTRLPMLVQLGVMALNVPLNYVLIYGHLGAPALGVDGAAIASVTATAAGFVAITALFARGVGAPRVPIGRLSLAELEKMLRYGVPAGLNWFVEFAAFAAFLNVVMASLGTTALAACMSVIQLNSVAFMPMFGLASAGSIFVGQAIGAKAHDDVPPTVWLTIWLGLLWMVAIGVLYLAFPAPLLRAFVGAHADADAFVELGVVMLKISVGWQVFDTVSLVVAEALRAAGDTAYTFWARTAIAWLVFVPGAYVSTVRYGGGPEVALAWLVAYLILLSVVLVLRFRGGRWRSLELTGETALAA